MTHAWPFDDLLVPSVEVSRATPSAPLDPTFRGIRIALPSRVPSYRSSPDEGVRLPLAGRITVDDRLSASVDPLERLTVVVASRSGRVHASGLGVARAREGAQRRGVVTYFFNADVARDLEIPGEPDVLFVHAFLGPWVSNGVRVVVGDEESP